MKKLNLYLFPFIAAIIILTSCGKDGAVGPTGATGLTGAVGPAGPAGANGTNGSVIYSGTTAPPATTGVIGDFYIDLSAGILYGPKTANGWGTGFSLIGATGATGASGAAGSKIYSGSGAPAITIGVTGDYYLDKTNFLLYGPKTVIQIGGRMGTIVQSWGVPIALQGPMGNANVKTDTFTVDHGQWAIGVFQLETANGAALFNGGIQSIQCLSYSRANNSVTQDVIDNGMVLVYVEPTPDETPENWYPVPFQVPVSASTAPNLYQYDFNFGTLTAAGQVVVGFYFSQPGTGVTLPDLTVYRNELTVNYRFKIVTVTGQAGVFMVQNHVNLKNYAEVSRALGLWQQDKLTH